MIRRPPTFIGPTAPAPPMPSVNPGTTWLSGNCAAWPRDQDESNCLPSLNSTPVYCTVTVAVGEAALPLPTTRSWQTRLPGLPAPFAVTFGSCLRLVACPTVTPWKVAEARFGGLAHGVVGAGGAAGCAAGCEAAGVELAAAVGVLDPAPAWRPVFFLLSPP